MRLSTWFTDAFVFLRIFIEDTIRIGVAVVVFVALFGFTNRSIDSVHLMLMVVNQLPTFFTQTASLTRLWILDASGELRTNFRRARFHCREMRRSNRWKSNFVHVTFVMKRFTEKSIADVISFAFTSEISIGVRADSVGVAGRIETFIDI